MQVAFTILAVAVALLTAIALTWDLRVRRIPNWLTVGGFAGALLFHCISGGFAGLGFSLGGFAIGFGLLLVLWLIGGGGGGDVKLMGALGAWLGPMHILYVFILSTVFVLVIAISRLVTRGLRRGMVPALKEVGGKQSSDAPRPASADNARLVPYALPVALSAWLVLAWKYFLLQG